MNGIRGTQDRAYCKKITLIERTFWHKTVFFVAVFFKFFYSRVFKLKYVLFCIYQLPINYTANKSFFVFVCSDELTLRTNLYQLAYFCRWYLHKNDIQFVFTSSCLYEGSCLLCVICVCLRIVVSNTYCAMFLFWLSLSCVPCVANFSGLFIFDCPFGLFIS